LATTGNIRQSKNRRKTAEHFKKFTQFLHLSKNVFKNAARQRKGMEICHAFTNSHCTILPSLLLADSGYLGISQQLSDTLKIFPEAFQ
jgi:hypothetical protein